MRVFVHGRIRVCDASATVPGWQLACVAEVQARPGERYQRTRHQHHTVECVLSGHGYVEVNGEAHHCEAGDSYWLPQGVAHVIAADEQTPWRKIYVNLHGTLLSELHAAYGLDGNIFRACDISADLGRLFDHHGNDRSLQLLTGQVLHGIVAAWHGTTRTGPQWPALVTTAKDFIDRHVEANIHLDDIARHAACSTCHLVRVFSRHIGTSPAAYLLKQRMHLAATLLATTSEPLKAIATRLHYSDAFAFSHAFSQTMGLAPSLWRQRHGGRSS